MKTTNEYSRTLGALFEEMPKAVLAAVAVSLAMRCTDPCDDFDAARKLVAEEWSILFDNGIVPQRPTALVRSMMPESCA